MAVYEHYATRDRIGLGVRIKRYQAARMFELALGCAEGDAASILEIGPGDGYVAQIARCRSTAYVGIESSEAVARHLQGQGISVIRATVPPLPPDLGTFDICFVLHVIEHMRDYSEASALIAGIRARLSARGVLVVACPDYIRWGYHFYDCDYTHSIPFTRRRLQRLLEDHGFLIRNFSIYSGPIFGYAGLPLGWLARLCYPAIADDLFGRHIPRDGAKRGVLTLLPNLLAVAKKKD
jgi:SAM-dependent methyltransferase